MTEASYRTAHFLFTAFSFNAAKDALSPKGRTLAKVGSGSTSTRTLFSIDRLSKLSSIRLSSHLPRVLRLPSGCFVRRYVAERRSKLLCPPLPLTLVSTYEVRRSNFKIHDGLIKRRELAQYARSRHSSSPPRSRRHGTHPPRSPSLSFFNLARRVLRDARPCSAFYSSQWRP